ncbi:hypothetical protein EON77_07710, partial [bacterium]
MVCDREPSSAQEPRRIIMVPMAEGETFRPLGEIRVDIDAIDGELVRLHSRRAELAQEVGRTKGLDGRPFFTPERERAIFDRLERENPGPLQGRQLK